jgi:hypothetical protein
MAMDAELYERVRKLEKQMAALLDRHPEVRVVLERNVTLTASEAPPAVLYSTEHTPQHRGERLAP